MKTTYALEENKKAYTVANVGFMKALTATIRGRKEEGGRKE